MSFDKLAEASVPATSIYMFSAADDVGQSYGISNVDKDELPDPSGKSGGACTSALLQTLWRDDEDEEDVQYSWADTLQMMREKMEEMGLTQTPQLSAARPIDANEEICITPPKCKGVKRALLIGINYTGESNALNSCHSDVRNVKEYLIQFQGFQRENMLIMMDDGNHHEPNKQLILDSLRKLCEISKSGDCIFFQFSGHGGQVKDRGGDEVLFPGDYADDGCITDEELHSEFVARIRPGVHVLAVIDPCHSGSAMYLPYTFRDDEDGFVANARFKPAIPGSALVVAAAGGKKKKEKEKKGDKKSKKKKDGESTGKKTKKSKNGSKEKKKGTEPEEDVAADTADEEDGEEEEIFKEVERPEPKKKRGLLGVFGRGKK
ncbi:caspase domain containing protein [Nitzschia inconspicua]|uniref:Caspase domain containing protein n=1 Tax=Nitzschia inconspicua TaxID=303405 RepID=A0A9K3LT65_9STRA|nr:caspase domain containing protein [Nitzschia inconspicua]